MEEARQIWELHLAALKKYRDGEYQAAIEQWESILKKYPGNADILANIEQARLRLTPAGENVAHNREDNQ